jgi:hypothetical protein
MKEGKTERFVMCIENRGNEASLVIGKVYPALRTEKIARDHGAIRVIDESGEDYLFSADRFVEVKLPRFAREALLRTRPEA